MGSAASATACETPGGDLRLPGSGLRFSLNQLRSLNSYVDTLWEEDQKGRISAELEGAVESLVQRIVDGAGQRDPRFRCCHLIALHRGKKMRSRSLEYLVTLDALPVLNSGSEDYRLIDGPVGYGRVRITGREADKWDEFLTPAGYLCRDKVVERWVELIARCAGARGGGGSRVLCARAATHAHPYTYCYLERASSPQTATERRLAIVEGAAWVMVRVGAGEAEAKLMLGARVNGCNPAAYTSKVPLTHPMAMLHYTSAQTGYYAVAVGPPSSIVCADRASTWQLWHPAMEAALDAHSSDLSTVARIAGALNYLIDKMREGSYQGTLRVLSRYAANCALRRRLDRCAAYSHAAARCCVAVHASHHLLLVLDSLYSICARGGTAGYVYPVDRGSVIRRGARDTDWEFDATCVKSCLTQLHHVAGEDLPPSPSESLEAALFGRWEGLNKELKSSSSKYSRRQMRYLWRVAGELIKCKNMSVSENQSNFRLNLIQVTSQSQEAVEELIHILAIMLDQARDVYLNGLHARTAADFDRELSIYRSKKWSKLKDYYDASSACLIDAVRRDPDLHREDLKDPIIIMKNILNWLQKAAKDDKKYLGPVLKPYLEALFASSMENSWFMEEFDEKSGGQEFDGLKEYCMGVHDGVLDPCMGLLDAAKKFAWAKALVDFVDRFRHVDFRLVFPTGDGMAISFPIKLPSRREHSSARTLTLSRRDKAEAKLRLAKRCVLGAFATALVGYRRPPNPSISRHGSSDEILASVKTGNYWRNSTKPDIIPSTSTQDLSRNTLDNQPKVRRRSRRHRPATSYGYPEISITKESDANTMRRKYHTLKSLVYTEPVESIKDMRERPRSAGSTLKGKEVLSRPSILETLDFINSVKDALCVEESGASDAEDTGWCIEDEWLVGQASPLNLVAGRCGANALHLALGDMTLALLYRGRFTILQELCSLLGDASEGALFALHRLARAARSRSSERATSSWKLPEADGVTADCPQKYKSRPPDYVSGDEAPPPPPPLPRHSSIRKQMPRYIDYLPPNRLQQIEHITHLTKLHSTDLQIKPSNHQLTSTNGQINSINGQINPTNGQLNPSNGQLSPTNLQLTSTNQQLHPTKHDYTGIINPIYDIKLPKNKFSVKRSKSLGRSFSSKNLGLEITRYNITLGPKSGKKTNDVVTAITGMSGETGLEHKNSFFQRYSTAEVVGDSYKISRVTID